MGRISPCYKCKKRKIGCHSNCMDYNAWVELIHEKHEQVHENRNKEMMLHNYQVDKARKLNKSNK